MILRLLSFMLFVLLVSSCKTKRSVPESPGPDRSKAELLQAIEDHNYQFEWFAAEAGVNIDSPLMGASGKLIVRVKRDSIIWAIVKKVGVEGARILVNPSLYAAINRIDGTYMRGSTDVVLRENGLDYDFYDLQEAIYGNVLLPDTSNVTIMRDNNQYLVTTKDSYPALRYVISASSLKIDKFTLESSDFTVEVNFDDYRKVKDNLFFSYKRSIAIVDQSGMKSLINLNYKKVLIDIPKSTVFNIPPHYTEVE